VLPSFAVVAAPAEVPDVPEVHSRDPDEDRRSGPEAFLTASVSMVALRLEPMNRKSNHKTEGHVRSHIFKVVIEEDAFEDGRKAFHASCPALQGCNTWGHTPEEALANIQEAVDLYIEDLIENGEPIPVDPERGAIEMSSPSVVVNV